HVQDDGSRIPLVNQELCPQSQMQKVLIEVVDTDQNKYQKSYTIYEPLKFEQLFLAANQQNVVPVSGGVPRNEWPFYDYWEWRWDYEGGGYNW
ncbi:hypothetical protein PSY31_22655, partial [Shigella flexneri]|nr:hypothetical protein [Shigella flexneri]